MAIKIMELFDLKYPIIQAPIGGIATPELAAAVSDAGGLGGLALSWSDSEDATKKIEKVRSLTQKRVYANFVLNFEPKALQKTLELGIDIIQFSWGMPSDAMIQLINSHKAIMGIQVTDKESAMRAISLGANYLVCQGTQAGGHVQASRPLEKALEEVLEVSNDIPVLASGGISSGKQMYENLGQGASGIIMGSRFVASDESGAHNQYKDSLVGAGSDDTVLTICMNKGWDSAAHRILRNSTFKMWERDGLPIVGSRPGETDKIGQNPAKKDIERYSFSAPTTGTTGEIEAMTHYAGTSVDNIKDITNAKSIIHRIWNEYLLHKGK